MVSRRLWKKSARMFGYRVRCGLTGEVLEDVRENWEGGPTCLRCFLHEPLVLSWVVVPTLEMKGLGFELQF